MKEPSREALYRRFAQTYCEKKGLDERRCRRTFESWVRGSLDWVWDP